MRSSVLIVDDHDGFRTVAHTLLEDAGFHVVGEASDGGSAIAECVRLDPDIVLLDVQLPDQDGFDVAVALAARGILGRPLIVLISTREAQDFRAELARAPVRGFISKSELSGPALRGLLNAP
jgi:DNA-binding NarL/FixJ family response regulator